MLLFDEVEKAHPDVFNLLLQVLDEGRLTDNKGRTVNFRNVIVIMTSNLGSDIIRERMDEWNNNMPAVEEEKLRNDVFAMLRRFMRPEFLNRIDEVVMFRPLTEEQIKEIVRIQLSALSETLKSRNISLDVSEDAVGWIAENGFDPQLGARPVKRLIQKEVVNNLSKEIIAGNIVRDDKVYMEVKNGILVFRKK